MDRGNVVTLACLVHRIYVGKNTIWIHFGFLVNVLVERQRNEIEKSSAKLNTWVPIKEISIM